MSVQENLPKYYNTGNDQHEEVIFLVDGYPHRNAEESKSL